MVLLEHIFGDEYLVHLVGSIGDSQGAGIVKLAGRVGHTAIHLNDRAVGITGGIAGQI